MRMGFLLSAAEDGDTAKEVTPTVDTAGQTKVACPPGKVTWSPEVVDVFTDHVMQLLRTDVQLLDRIERQARTGTGTEHLFERRQHSHSKSGHLGVDSQEQPDVKPVEEPAVDIHFKRKDDDMIGEILDEMFVSRDSIQTLLVPVCESAAPVYTKVRKKMSEEWQAAKKDREITTDNAFDKLLRPQKPIEDSSCEEKAMRLSVLREGICREAVRQTRRKLREVARGSTLTSDLLAHPMNYKEGPLNLIPPETLAEVLSGKGWSVLQPFLGEEMRKAIDKEIAILDADSGLCLDFEGSDMGRDRGDRFGWFNEGSLGREQFPSLRTLFHKLSSVPFELNLRAQLRAQTCQSFQISCCPGNGAGYPKHKDGGSTAVSDNGRMLTVVYYPNPPDWQESDGGYLEIFPREESTMETDGTPSVRIRPAGDNLVLYLSRSVPHAVLPAQRRRYAVTMWVSAPHDKGDGRRNPV